MIPREVQHHPAAVPEKSSLARALKLIHHMRDASGPTTPDMDLDIPFTQPAELLRAHARRDPLRVALHDLETDTSITWGEVDDWTIRIANRLEDAGITRGSKVVLLADACLEELLVWLAAWRLGGVVCPLNIEMAGQHLGDILAMIDPAIVLWNSALAQRGILSSVPAPNLRFGRWMSRPQSGEELFGALGDVEPVDRPRDLRICRTGIPGRYLRAQARYAVLLRPFAGAHANPVPLDARSGPASGHRRRERHIHLGPIYTWMSAWLPELYPTRTRATGIGFVFNAPRLIAWVGPLIAGTLIAHFSGYGNAALVVSSIYLLGLATAPFLPETRGKPLMDTV